DRAAARVLKDVVRPRREAALERDVAADVVAEVEAEHAAVGHLPVDQQIGVGEAADRVLAESVGALRVEPAAKVFLGPEAVAEVEGDEHALARAGGYGDGDDEQRGSDSPSDHGATLPERSLSATPEPVSPTSRPDSSSPRASPARPRRCRRTPSPPAGCGRPCTAPAPR